MKLFPEGPTATALGVAWVRAFYSRLPQPLGVVQDPIAGRLIPAPLAALARVPSLSPRLGAAVQSALTRAFSGMPTNIALRTAAIDDAIDDAVHRGSQQMVILGSGLDARSWRMDALHDTAVFELDRASSHRYKQKRLRQVPSKTRSHSFVPIDFEREKIRNVLRKAGHDPSLPTTWLWEGVAIYLTREATDQTLDAIAHLSAPRSTVIATYTCPNLGRGNGSSMFWRAAARAVGEPIRGETTTDDLHARLGQRNFEVLSDEGNNEAIHRYWGDAHAGDATEWERVVVAIRRSC